MAKHRTAMACISCGSTSNLQPYTSKNEDGNVISCVYGCEKCECRIISINVTFTIVNKQEKQNETAKSTRKDI